MSSSGGNARGGDDGGEGATGDSGISWSFNNELLDSFLTFSL
jgi:hypothetical protein